MYIVLNAEQAAIVRGVTTPHSALNPMPTLVPGQYVLPDCVLQDEAHEIHHAYLKALPKVPTVSFPPSPILS